MASLSAAKDFFDGPAIRRTIDGFPVVREIAKAPFNPNYGERDVIPQDHVAHSAWSTSVPGRRRWEDEFVGKPGIQPNNPTKNNTVTLQSYENYARRQRPMEGPHRAYDRFPNDTLRVPRLETRDGLDHVTYARSNDYNPRKYPTPGCQQATLGVRKQKRPSIIGRTAVGGPMNPKPLPPTGSNDVMWQMEKM